MAVLDSSANAKLKRWRVLTIVVRAVQTLHYLTRDPFGASRIDTVS